MKKISLFQTHILNKKQKYTVLGLASSVVDPDPDLHYFGKLDPDPHQSGQLDPDPHQSKKQDPDPDPHQSEKVKALDGPSKYRKKWVVGSGSALN
jgi:hypothetical protein